MTWRDRDPRAASCRGPTESGGRAWNRRLGAQVPEGGRNPFAEAGVAGATQDTIVTLHNPVTSGLSSQIDPFDRHR